LRIPAIAAVVLIAALAGVRVGAQAGVELEVPTAPVELDGDILFRVRGASSYPAAVRAAAIRDRLTAIANDRSIAPETITATPIEGGIRIHTGEHLVMNVVDADATLEQVSLTALAAAQVMRIRQAVVDYRAARTPDALRSAAINIAAATAIVLIVVLMARRASRSIESYLRRRWQKRIKTVGIQSFEVVRAEQIWEALHNAFLTVRLVVVGASLLMFVGYVLAQLPWTRGMSRDMVAFTLAPLRVLGAGLVAQIPSLMFLLVLFVIVRIILRLTHLFFDAVENGRVTLHNFDPDWAQPTYKIARAAIVAFGVIIAYPYIPGSDSDAFKGISVFIGVVFSLGSSSAIANIVAGYMMTYRRAFKVGDRIRVGDTIGEVTQVRLQVTHLRSPKNEEVVISNAELLGAEVRNYSSLSRSSGLILHTEVGIGYETPWRQVEAMLMMAAERTAGVSREQRPFVLQKRLGDFAVTYELNVYTNDATKMLLTYSDLHRNILDVFNEYGVQIMTPAYEGDPAEPKIVAKSEWHRGPAAAPTSAVDGASHRGQK
jgi:small-conductance mechanosensitive channel